jgi:hypothetical protein
MNKDKQHPLQNTYKICLTCNELYKKKLQELLPLERFTPNSYKFKSKEHFGSFSLQASVRPSCNNHTNVYYPGVT